MRDLQWPEDTIEYKRDRFLRRMEAVSSKRESHMERCAVNNFAQIAY